jgi:glutathione synthase/RimK-type ligase-like ATP-grasp enzyme
MVLLYGIPGDGPFELVADALEELETPFLILNQRRFEELDFIIHLSENGLEGEITIGPHSFPLDSFTGIYNRGVDFSMLPEAKLLLQQPTPYNQYAQLFDLLNQWIEIADCRVVNKGSAMSSNSAKPYQLTLIEPYFCLPETLITNFAPALQDFQKVHSDIIFKSVSSVRSVVKTISEGENISYQSIAYCPTLFQKKLTGCNYRVHVVGANVYATMVESETVDYRYSNLEGKETILSPVELQKDIKEKCIALANALNLPFAGIDLFESGDGKWYCFEVNPSPGFSYFENKTGQPIAKAIATYLAGR